MARAVSTGRAPEPERRVQTDTGQVGSSQCTLAATCAARALAPSDLGSAKTAPHAPKAFWSRRTQRGRDHSVVKSWGLASGRPRRRRGPELFRKPLRPARRCHEIWTVDFKGWYRTGNGQRV